MDEKRVRLRLEIEISREHFDEFERIALAMTVNSKKEPGTIAYEWCLSSDRRQCRLLETYADGAALVEHLTAQEEQELVPRLLEIAIIGDFEVYGDPGQEGEKILARFGAQIYAHWQGWDRGI